MDLRVAWLFLTLGARLLAAPAFDLQAEVNRAIAAGGGEVIVPPGEHVLPRGLKLDGGKSVLIAGFDRDSCILKLPAISYAYSTSHAPQGATELRVDRPQAIKPGMQLRLETKPLVNATASAVENGLLKLTAPLPSPIPAGTYIRDEHSLNLIEIRNGAEGIRLRKLTLDGGVRPNDPSIRGQGQFCGILIQGSAAAQPRGIEVTDCIVRNCFGPGIAVYGATEFTIQRCTIMDTGDAAIELGQLTTKAIIQNNYIARSPVAFAINGAAGCKLLYNEAWDCVAGVHEGPASKQNEFLGNSFDKTATVLSK